MAAHERGGGPLNIIEYCQTLIEFGAPAARARVFTIPPRHEQPGPYCVVTEESEAPVRYFSGPRNPSSPPGRTGYISSKLVTITLYQPETATGLQPDPDSGLGLDTAYTSLKREGWRLIDADLNAQEALVQNGVSFAGGVPPRPVPDGNGLYAAVRYRVLVNAG